MKPARRIIALLLVLVLAVPLAACGGDGDDVIYFRFGFGDEPDSLNPYFGTHASTYYVFASVYDTLFTRDVNYELVGSLCTGYETARNQDGTCTYTMTLRDDVSWHDGEKFTAADVAFTLYTTYNWSYAHSFDVLFLDPDSIEVSGDTTVSFTVEADYPYITEYLATCPIYPEHVWKQYFTDEGGGWLEYDDERVYEVQEVELNADTMTGTGPFKWHGADETACTLVRNDKYWNGKSAIEALVYVYNVAEPLTALQNGELDACEYMTASALDAIKGDANFDYALSMSYGFNSISFNLNSPDEGSTANQLLQIKEVRQAIDYCVQREYILDMACSGLGVAGDSMLGANNEYYYSLKDNYAGYRDSDAEDHTQKAVALLERAGFTYNASGAAYGAADRAANAVRHNAQGEALSFRLSYDSNNREDEDTCTIVAQACLAAGIGVNVQGFDQATLWDYCDAYDYDMYIVEWGAYVDPSFSLSLFQWEDGYWAYANNGYNESGYGNDEYDGLFNEQLYTKDEAERRAIIKRMQEIFYEDCPMIILGYYYYIQPVNAGRWQGYRQLPQDFEYGLLWDYTTMPYNLLNMQYVGK